MLKRSSSERSHSTHVKTIGVKVLPSTFRMPPLRATGIDIKSPLPDDSAHGPLPHNLPMTVSSEFNTRANVQLESKTRDKPSDQVRYISKRSFDDLDLEELTESERDLKIDYELGRAEHDRRAAYEVVQAKRLGQHNNKKLQEVLRLDEVLKMCTEYEQQVQTENQLRQSLTEKRNSLRPCNVTKIKTNGSLTSPVHIRRYAELSKERYSNSHFPRVDLETGSSFSQYSVELSPDSDRNAEWTNADEQLSLHSSCEFLDKSLSSNRSQSFYENDEAFVSFQTDFLNNDNVLHDSSLHLTAKSSSSNYVAPGSMEETGFSRRYLLTASNSSDFEANRVSDRKANLENQKLDSELAKLKQMKIESAERMVGSKNQMIEVDNLQEKVIQELENELEILLTESTVELASAKLEDERMAVVKEQQMELLMQAAKERDEFQQQIETERRKLEELKALQRETRKRLETCSPVEIQAQLLLTVKENKEAVDTQQRAFDDLEFSLLELETRREEEREPMQKKLAAELVSLLKLKSQREETLCTIEKQKLDILHQANTDITNLERERHMLMKAFKKERLMYLAVVEQITRVTVHAHTRRSNDEISTGTGNVAGEENSWGSDDLPSSPSSSSSEDLCKTPPTRVRIRRTLLNLEQEHQPNSMQSWRSARKGSVSSRMLNSEGALEVNGDVSPSSKVFSSGSEDSSFNSLEGILKDETSRVDIGSKSQELLPQLYKEEKLFEPGKSQGGGRGLGRSLSEPRKPGRLELNSNDSSAMTDQEIRFRENQRSQARPLTRYLPVRDKHLDLRNFVESSGHFLDDSSQVLVGVTTCCGYLKKQGGKFRTWHKRWFVLDRNKRCLTYYLDRTETKLRRSIYFQSILDVFVDHLRTVVSPNQKLTFCLKTLDRRYYLVAPTAEAMRIWIDVLFTGAEGYQEFC